MSDLNLKLYEDLYLCRRAEELIIEHYPENEMRTPMHMSMGQEAIAVGVCAALGDSGQVFSSYRSHAAFLAKTHDPEMFFGELYGRTNGTAQGKGGSMHLVCAEKGFLGASGIVASTIPVAVGASFSNKRLGNGRIVAVFFGDGAVDEGAFWESLNVACLMELPILFVCEDNGYAVHTEKKSRRGYRSVLEILSRFDTLYYEDDTADVEIIYRMTKATVQDMRKTEFPGFMNLKCTRLLEHVGVNEDWNAGYREKNGYEDPLAIQRAKIPEEEATKVEGSVNQQLNHALLAAMSKGSPSDDRLPHGIFHETD